MKYDKEKYNQGMKKLVTQPIIYVEGSSNKIFYQQIEELNDKFIDNGGNCNNIRRKVKSDSNYYGIVDRDYHDISEERIFVICFYSLENAALIYIDKMEYLRSVIKKCIYKNTLNNAKFHKLKLSINRGRNKRVRNFDLIITESKHH
uniref:hypothetical protein n=1 Tax=Metasolibacillus meyeri TaxID=1071052 RepID=UPI00193110CF